MIYLNLHETYQVRILRSGSARKTPYEVVMPVPRTGLEPRVFLLCWCGRQLLHRIECIARSAIWTPSVAQSTLVVGQRQVRYIARSQVKAWSVDCGWPAGEGRELESWDESVGDRGGGDDGRESQSSGVRKRTLNRQVQSHMAHYTECSALTIPQTVR